MKITFITVCSALAAVSIAEAVPAHRRHENRPRYYFPRVVKRQVDSPFGNSTASSSGGLDGLLSSVGDTLSSVAGIVDGGATTTDPNTTPTQASGNTLPPPTTTDGGLLGDVSSLASGLLAPTTTPTTAFTVGVDTLITGSTTSSDGSLLGAVTSAASQVLGSASDAASSVLSVASSLQDAVSTAAASDLASISSALASAQNAASSLASQVSSAQSVITTGPSISLPISPSITGSVPIDTGIGSFSPSVDTGSLTFSPPINTGSQTFSPTASPPPPPSETPTFSPPPSQTPTFSPLPSETPAFSPPPAVHDNTTEPVPTPTATPTPIAPSTSIPETIKPTGTDTNTAFTPASSIMSATIKPTPSAPSSSSSAIPTTLPRVITPEGGVPDAPANSTLIQIGFVYGLNYEFVVKSSTAVAQIFTYLPMGVTTGLNIPEKEMVMQYLQPYNTLPTAGYITTLAMAYVPSDQLDQLSVDLLNPRSSLYTQGSDSVKTLMSMVDPTVPLLAGSQLNGGTPINSAGGSVASNTDGQNGAPGGDAGQNGGPVRPSSVGIAVGAVCGAAVYGAAMFLVARRYKKRRAAHQRSSSLQSGGPRRPAETSNLMTGARNSYGSRFPTGRGSRNSDRSDESGSGRSGRTYISPPVMAENSLGWN